MDGASFAADISDPKHSSKRKKHVPDGDDDDDDGDDSTVFKRPNNHQQSSLMIDDYSGKGNQHRKVNFHSLDQYTRHKLLVNYYRLTYPGAHGEVFKRDNSKDKSDLQVLFENHRFIWPEEELQSDQLTWGQRVAKKYYDRLFKEYCIVDLSLYGENKFGMRWRTEPEVLDGKGQFICGAKRCMVRQDLTSWEVLFGYKEHGQKKSALIKLRLCPGCSAKLNYHRQHAKAKKVERRSKRRSKSGQKFLVDIEGRDVKEEIISEDEASKTKKDGQTIEEAEQDDDDEHYEQLIDRIWRQPVKTEQNTDTDGDDDDDEERQKENDLDDYLNEFFM